MKASSRIAIAAAVTLLAAVLSGPALAALAPTFAVTGPRLGADSAFGPTFALATPAGDDALAKLTIYVPTGWTLASPASPTSMIGHVTATFRLGDRSNAVQSAQGTIVGASTTLGTTVSSCDGSAHLATWLMNLNLAGQQLAIPMFVAQATGTDAPFAAYRVVACLPPPDLPAGTAGRSPLGAKLLTARFNIDNFTGGGGNGEQVWRALWTPYRAGSGQPNADGAVETQSIVRVPTIVTLSAKRVKGARSTRVTLNGTLKEANIPVGGVAVTIGSGLRTTQLKNLRVLRTDSAGRFTTRVSITKTRWFAATASMPQRSLPASFCKATFGLPCVSATIGASRVVGKGVKVAR
jgi:hypothetical protein